MPYSWNPTRARGVGVQDMLATSDGLYVGSDTELIGHTAGNTYHARIALLPLATGTKLPQLQAARCPADIYKVATGASSCRSAPTSPAPPPAPPPTSPTGPGWGTSTGAFMVNGVLYKVNTDGSLSKMTFDGTTYGTVTAVNTADALVAQTDWHTDAKTIDQHLLLRRLHLLHEVAGTNALYRRGFEVEDGVVGQQRFSTHHDAASTGATSAAPSSPAASSTTPTRPATCSRATWNQAGHAPWPAPSVQHHRRRHRLGLAGAVPATRPRRAGQRPAGRERHRLLQPAAVHLRRHGVDRPGGRALTYDWDFGDGTAHGSGATTTHTYGSCRRPCGDPDGDRQQGRDQQRHQDGQPDQHADPISFVNSNNNNGSRSNHTITVPAGTQVGDTLLLFFTANSIEPRLHRARRAGPRC